MDAEHEPRTARPVGGRAGRAGGSTMTGCWGGRAWKRPCGSTTSTVGVASPSSPIGSTGRRRRWISGPEAGSRAGQRATGTPRRSDDQRRSVKQPEDQRACPGRARAHRRHPRRRPARGTGRGRLRAAEPRPSCSTPAPPSSFSRTCRFAASRPRPSTCTVTSTPQPVRLPSRHRGVQIGDVPRDDYQLLGAAGRDRLDGRPRRSGQQRGHPAGRRHRGLRRRAGRGLPGPAAPRGRHPARHQR